MTEAGSSQRKPAASEGDRRPPLMVQLGISSWTTVPNTVVEHWMSQEFPTKLRVMACVVRYTFGFQSLACIQDGRTRRPMQQADIARLLNLHKGSVTHAVQELVLERLVRFDGRQLYAIANPSEAPQPKLELPGQQEIPEVTDPEYLREIERARAEYSRTIQQARAVLRQQLEQAKRHYQARQTALASPPEVAASATLPPTEELRIPAQKVAGSATFELPDSQPVSLLKKKNKYLKERKRRAGEEFLLYSTSEQPKTTPARPPPPLEDKDSQRGFEYLNQFAPQIGKSPDPKITREFLRRLKGASIEQVETLRQQRCATGLVFHSYGIFLELAADCARSKEAFEVSGAPSRPKSREAQQAEDYARRRRGER